jgi:hypothetical protein
MAVLNTEGRSLFVGALIGGAAVALARGVSPAVGEVARPLAKAIIRLGMTGGERGLELYGRLTETVEDLAAEVVAERSSELGDLEAAHVAGVSAVAAAPTAVGDSAARGAEAGGAEADSAGADSAGADSAGAGSAGAGITPAKPRARRAAAVRSTASGGANGAMKPAQASRPTGRRTKG